MKFLSKVVILLFLLNALSASLFINIKAGSFTSRIQDALEDPKLEHPKKTGSFTSRIQEALEGPKLETGSLSTIKNGLKGDKHIKTIHETSQELKNELRKACKKVNNLKPYVMRAKLSSLHKNIYDNCSKKATISNIPDEVVLKIGDLMLKNINSALSSPEYIEARKELDSENIYI